MDDSKPSGEIAPTSAGWTVDYIMDVDLQSKDGTNIPLYNKHLRMYQNEVGQRYIVQEYGAESERFRQEKEDYWLFHIHSNNAQFEIAIGGETPVLVSSKPNWTKITNDDTETLYTTYWEEDPSSQWQERTIKSRFVLEQEREYKFNRFLAVRCPRMDNPAITVKGKGHFACLHWVGLFIRSTAQNTHKFVALRTTNELLPQYGERNRRQNYPWFEETGPADVTGRTITLFPKQLYGTNGSDGRLYDQFVTTDPNNQVGHKHLDLVRKLVEGGSSLWAYKYTWAASGRTIIETEDDPNPGYDPPLRLDYVSGLKLQGKTINGLTLLLTVFNGITKVASGLLTGSIAGVVEGVIGMGDVFDGEKMMQEADIKGFVSAAAKAVDEYNKKNSGKQKKEPPNTLNIYSIHQKITNNTVMVAHFGTGCQAEELRYWTLKTSGVEDDHASPGRSEGYVANTEPPL